MDDGTTASIDQLLGAAAHMSRMEKEASGMPAVTQQHNIGTLNASVPWIVRLAKTIITLFLVFVSSIVMSLPIVQDLVLSQIPKAVTHSGVLSNVGVFSKAGLTTVLFATLNSIVLG